MVCIRCQKRPAIIFIQRMVDGQMKQEGYCLHCARELHIKPVDDLMKQFGMSDQDLDNMENRMESMMEELGDSNPLSMMMNMTQGGEDAPDEELSAREREILVAVCRGLSHQEIADELFISKRTVDKHRANILEKTGCKNTASLVVYAIRKGIVEI